MTQTEKNAIIERALNVTDEQLADALLPVVEGEAEEEQEEIEVQTTRDMWHISYRQKENIFWLSIAVVTVPGGENIAMLHPREAQKSRAERRRVAKQAAKDLQKKFGRTFTCIDY